MPSFSPKRHFVTLENKRQRLNVEGCTSEGCTSWSIPMMTAGLGRRGAPTLASLYKPKNNEHKLARAELFDQTVVSCRKYPRKKGKLMHIRQAFDFIREQRPGSLSQDIWQGLFEQQYKRFRAPESGELQISEEFLMAYINSLDAAIGALEAERAIAMFAEGEQVTVDSLTLKMYFPFSDAMEQQDLIDKAVQKQIKYRVAFGLFQFFKSLSLPVTRRLLDLFYKFELYGKRTHQRFSDPFYSAKIFRRTLNQANLWFFAEEHRRRSLTDEEHETEFLSRISCAQIDWSFYEKNAMSWALAARDPEHAFVFETKQKMVGWAAYRLTDFFRIFWELQERERQQSILVEVEAWTKRHCVT